MKARIGEFVSTELLSGRTVAEDDDLLLSGLVDSIGVMRLVAFLEEAAGIRIPPEDVTIEHFMSVAAIARYCASRGQP